MYAIIEADGVQHKVEEGMTIKIDRKQFETGTKVTVPTVVFISDGQRSIVGKPYIDDASVEAEFVDHFKGTKVVIFKKKRRKGFSKKTGHRQQYTMLKINKINAPKDLVS